MTRAAVLCIGTELTRGEIQNSNATWLAQRLTEIGIEVLAIEVVADSTANIEATLSRLAATHDVVVCTGGLGPTTDDLTTECVAHVLGVPLRRDEASLQTIRARLTRFGREMAESNAKQADFPESARILPNPNGTAPGFAVEIARARCFFMPGVPREMKSMFDASIAPELAPLVSEHVGRVRLRCFGLPESSVNDALAGVEAAHGVTLAYRAHFPEIEVKVLARAASKDDADRRARAAADAIRQRLGKVVYAEGDHALPHVVGELLERRRRRFALAESCTGGLVAELVTERPGASRYFMGGVVSYSNQSKQDLLDVPAELLAAHGAVSAEVAEAMARGALRAFHADVALSLTGVAGPDGGTPEKPVGLVYYAVAIDSNVVVRQMNFPGTRGFVQQLAAWHGLSLVRELLSDGPT